MYLKNTMTEIEYIPGGILARFALKFMFRFHVAKWASSQWKHLLVSMVLYSQSYVDYSKSLLDIHLDLLLHNSKSFITLYYFIHISIITLLFETTI